MVYQAICVHTFPTHVMIYRSALKRIKQLMVWLQFISDYLRSLCSDRYTATPSSYALMRMIYSLTQGKSSFILSKPFSLLHPISSVSDESIKIAADVRAIGYAKIEAFVHSKEIANSLHNKLSMCKVKEVLHGFKLGAEFRNPQDAFESACRQGARLNHKRSDVVKQSETWKLIQIFKMRDIASVYLGCDPIITSIDSWHVAPIKYDTDSKDLYSAAAQTYHYDMDWIKFLKIFVNLTDAFPGSGPFEFIPYSHIRKHSYYYRDGRFETLPRSELNPVFADGQQGSAFWADTSGIHRDGRAKNTSRHVLQVEFAVSSFGAKFQYEDIFNECSKLMPWDLIPEKLKSGRTLSMFKPSNS